MHSYNPAVATHSYNPVAAKGIGGILQRMDLSTVTLLGNDALRAASLGFDQLPLLEKDVPQATRGAMPEVDSDGLLTTCQAAIAHLAYQVMLTPQVDLEYCLLDVLSKVCQIFQATACGLVINGRASQPACFLGCTHSQQRFVQRNVKLTQAKGEFPFFVTSGANLTEPASTPMSQAVMLWDAQEGVSFSVQALMGGVLTVEGQPWGVVNLVKAHPYSWKAAEIVAFQTMVQQLGEIVSRYRLLQQCQQQHNFQTVTSQLALAIHRASDLTELLQIATRGMATALGIKRALLLRLRYSDPLWRSRAVGELPRARIVLTCEYRDGTVVYPTPSILGSSKATNEGGHQPLSFWLSECHLCQRAFSAPEQPIELNYGTELLLVGDQIAPLFSASEFPALLLAPLANQGTVLGFLVLQHDQPYFWQPEERQLVELLQAQMSTAIIQTETLRQVQALVEKRTAELRESLSVQAKLYELTRQQVDQLRRLNQLKDGFLSTVSHELRTPLTSMRIAIRMLRQVGLESDRSAHYLNILEQQCIQEANLVNDLLALQELESNRVQMQPEELDICQMINEVASAFRQQWAEKGLTLRLSLPPYPVRLYSDRNGLNRILVELLANAGKYSALDTQVHLSLTELSDRSNHRVVLVLSNLGVGIPQDELPYIFDKFRRCQEATQNAIQGTGLGLALVKSLLQHLGGTVEVSSYPLEGKSSTWKTQFKLQLPQQLGSESVA